MRNFRYLLAASTVSSLGNGMRWIALPLLAAHLSSDPLAVSAVTAAQQLPFLVFALFAGVMADRADRRQLMWRASLGRGVLMAAFTALIVFGHASIWLAAAVGFLITCGDAIGTAAHAGLVPMIVAVPDR